MRLTAAFFIAFFGVLIVGVNAWAQERNYDRIEILAEKISSNLYLLSGSAGADPAHEDAAGGRIGVLVGSDGIFMVDAQYEELTGKVLAAIRKISPQPIRYLVNTHVHRDHTAGDANFVRMGATLFAREELREELLKTPGKDPAGIPTVTYGLGSPLKFRMNNEIIDLIPVRAAHTGGDTMIRFENANVILIGDFYRNFGYPYVDTANGGTLKGMLEALDMLYELANPATKLVPGHGTIITREALKPYRDMILTVRTRVLQMIDQGRTLQEVLAVKVTAPFDAKVAGGQLPAAGSGTSADRFVNMVYSELKGGT